MAIKSYTDINQSRKLAEILPLESADMYYGYRKDKPNYLPYSDAEVINLCLPCWSLTALLGVLPKAYSLGRRIYGKYYVCMTCVKHDVIDYDNPVDACVAMVEKLNELKVL